MLCPVNMSGLSIANEDGFAVSGIRPNTFAPLFQKVSLRLISGWEKKNGNQSSGKVSVLSTLTLSVYYMP